MDAVNSWGGGAWVMAQGTTGAADAPSMIELRARLDAWVADPSSTGDKATAATRIIEAFQNRSAVLDLYELALSVLPPEIGQLTWLKELNLNGNELTALPPEIAQLNQLEELWLAENLLQVFPPEILEFTQLQILVLCYNELRTIPQEVEGLCCLRRFQVSNNQIVAVPPGIGQLSELRSLYLDNNRLVNLPQAMERLAQLAFLTLYDNPELSALPMSLGQIPGLTQLSVKGTNIPAETCRAILAATRRLRRQMRMSSQLQLHRNGRSDELQRFPLG